MKSLGCHRKEKIRRVPKIAELFVVTLLTLCIKNSNSTAHEYISRMLFGQVIHCIPVYDCEPGKEILPCLEQYSKDICQKCQNGFVQPNFISSHSNGTNCFKPLGQCDRNSLIHSPTPYPIDSCSGTKYCRCNNSACFYGNPCFCDERRRLPCVDGETMNEHGECVKCPEGTEKNHVGCGPCKRINSSATTVQKKVTTTSTVVGDDKPVSVKGNTTVPNANPLTDSVSKKSDGTEFVTNSVLIALLIVCIVIIVSLTMVAFYIWRKRKITTGSLIQEHKVEYRPVNGHPTNIVKPNFDIPLNDISVELRKMDNVDQENSLPTRQVNISMESILMSGHVSLDDDLQFGVSLTGHSIQHPDEDIITVNNVQNGLFLNDHLNKRSCDLEGSINISEHQVTQTKAINLTHMHNGITIATSQPELSYAKVSMDIPGFAASKDISAKTFPLPKFTNSVCERSSPNNVFSLPVLISKVVDETDKTSLCNDVKDCTSHISTHSTSITECRDGCANLNDNNFTKIIHPDREPLTNGLGNSSCSSSGIESSISPEHSFSLFDPNTQHYGPFLSASERNTSSIVSELEFHNFVLRETENQSLRSPNTDLKQNIDNDSGIF